MAEEELRNATPKNMKEMLVEKAHELFSMCDKDTKGIVTKRDMQHLIGELPLSPDQLEIVFDSLDKDKNGFLSLQEFTDGFGMFLGINTTSTRMNKGYCTDHEMDQPLADIEEEIEDCEEDAFGNLLNQLGGRNIIKDEDTVRQIWLNLRDLNADICSKFEDVLGRLIQEIKTSKMEHEDLESALKSRMTQHDDEVTQLYEEMERQIKTEKECLLAEERSKEKKVREELQHELLLKENALQDLLIKQSEMEKRLSDLTSTGTETKQENANLQKERDALERRLLKSERLVQEMQRHLEGIRHETLEEKRKRAKATLEVTEGIALERESLVRELDVLRSTNKWLLDEKDFLDSSFGSKWNSAEDEIQVDIDHLSHEDNLPVTNTTVPKALSRGTLVKQGSVLSDYIGSDSCTPRTSLCSGISLDDKELHGIEEETVTVEPNSDVAKWINNKIVEEESMETNSMLNTNENQKTEENNTLVEDDNQVAPPTNIYTFTGEQASQVVWKVKCIVYPEAITDTADDTHKTKDEWKCKKIYHSFCDGEARCFIPENEEVVKLKRSIYQSLSNSQGPNKTAQHNWKIQLTVFPASMLIIPFPDEEFVDKKIDQLDNGKTQTPVSPERVFKIVFIGDSGVGKSSFIQRFCHNEFRPYYSATIGVDFQVRSVEVGGRTVALQFWDTAGQERFRSITKQYYRRADGVIIMYDITSESSFKSVREWINNIKDDTSDFAVMLVVGNKFDLCEEDKNRVVKEKDGLQLAQEYGALFYETSSCTGHQVEDSVMEMASLLQVKEDEELERVLHLQEVARKNKCC